MKLMPNADLTPKQKSTLQYIFNCGKKLKKKLDDCAGGTDEELKLKEHYDKCKKDFEDVYTARARYNEHIHMADYHITEAEKIKKEWEF